MISEEEKRREEWQKTDKELGKFFNRIELNGSFFQIFDSWFLINISRLSFMDFTDNS